MSVKTLGRCPDCGHSAPILAVDGEPTQILEHGCQARACECPGCLVIRPPEDMIRFPAGSWYCPAHALLTVGRELVALHRTGADEASFVQLLEKTLPTVLDRFPA
jgi:hypothetical protein